MTAEPIPEPVVAQEPMPAMVEPQPALAAAVASPSILLRARRGFLRARGALSTGLLRIARTLVPIGLFAVGIVLGISIFGASRPTPAFVGGSGIEHVEPPPVVRELVASLETNDADATRSSLGAAPYGLLAGELQEWGYQEVTDVETLGTFVEGTASSTAIVLRGHDTNSRPLITNLVVQVERGAIVNFR